MGKLFDIDRITPGGKMKHASTSLCLLLAGLLAACSQSQPAGPSPAVTAPSPAIGATAATEAGEDDHPEPAAPPPLEAAAPVAEGFAAAWVSKTDPPTWWQQVAQWCDPALAQALRSADPANVPASSVTGPATLAGGSAEEGIRFSVTTNTGTLLMTLAALDGDWRVSTVDFLRSTT